MATYACVGSNYFLCNNIVFVYCFFEIFINVLLFSALKDEKYQRLKLEEESMEKIEVEEIVYGDGDEDDLEYETVVSEIRERVRNL